MNFSIVLIAKNEINTLPKLINSLEEFKQRGGEIILVDTGSSDGTPDKARELGCKVIEVGAKFLKTIDKEKSNAINNHFIVDGESPVVNEYDILFDYSEARNYAASLASNDFVFMPDCDEAYTKFDIDKLEESIKNGTEQLEYNFVYAHDSNGRPTIEFMHCKAYDRRKLKWVGIIHEILQGDAKRQYLPPDIIKLEHFQNHATNRSSYLTGLALDCFENPNNDRNSHYFARELFWKGRPKSAIKEFDRHIKMNRWAAERSQSAVFTGDCYLQLGDEEQALYWWNKALEIEAGRREPLMRLAEFYFRKNDHQRTAIYAEGALTIKQRGFYADNAEHYRHYPHELLYWAYWYLGEMEKAKEHFDKAFYFSPENRKYLFERHLFYPEEYPLISIILPTLGREEGLRRAKESIKRLVYPKIELLVEDGEGTVPFKVDKMYKESKGEWIVYASNDIEFDPMAIYEALQCAKREKKRLIAFNTGPVGGIALFGEKKGQYEDGNHCEHFMIHRSLADELGEIFNTRFHHVGVDNLLWAKANKLNEATRCDMAKIEHYHYSKNKSDYDDVYKKGWANAEEDRKLLKEELNKLNN